MVQWSHVLMNSLTIYCSVNALGYLGTMMKICEHVMHERVPMLEKHVNSKRLPV
jgi:hypothetical protein